MMNPNCFFEALERDGVLAFTRIFPEFTYKTT